MAAGRAHLPGSWNGLCKGPGAGELAAPQKASTVPGEGEGEEGARDWGGAWVALFAQREASDGVLLGGDMIGFLFFKAHAGGRREKGLGVGRPGQRSLQPSRQAVEARTLWEPDPVGAVGVGCGGSGTGRSCGHQGWGPGQPWGWAVKSLPDVGADGAGTGVGPQTSGPCGHSLTLSALVCPSVRWECYSACLLGLPGLQ